MRFELSAMILLLLALSSSVLRAEVTASVDRTEVAMDESFVLTLTVSELKVFSQPDLSPLEKDFHILGSSQNSNTSIINGKLRSSTSWSIQLMPKRPGKTSIPPIAIGKNKTHIIEMVVNKRSQGATSADGDSIMLEAELSENTVYVSAQALLTIRVSLAQAARFQLEEPELDEAIVQQIGEANFQQIRGGRRFQVTEYTFAIFPNTPGELLIEPLNLVAEIMSNRPRSMFDPMLGQSKRVLRRTEPLTLNVIAAPEGINSVDWLPAADVSLTQQWSGDISQLHVGESITRTIELEARGVMASQLPPLFLPNVDGLKFYPDQPTVADEHSASGITGKRQERIAIVATKPGHYQLPEQTIQWWDVNSNRARVATLPALRFEVIATGQTTAGPPRSVDGAAQTREHQATSPMQLEPVKSWYQYRQWWWISATLILACLALALLYLQARRQSAQALASAPADRKAAFTPIDSEARARQGLRAAADAGDARALYHALQSWCRCYWQLAIAPSFEDLQQLGASATFIAQARALQQHVYGPQAGAHWDAAALLEAVDEQRRQPQADSDAAPALPPLYR